MPTYYLSANRDSIQSDPHLLQLANGEILGLWTDLYPDPDVDGTFGVYGRTWRSDMGAASITDTRINSLTADIQHRPTGTVFGNGNFAIVFESRGPSAINGHDDAYYDTYIRFYRADGSAIGPARQMTPNTSNDHNAVDVATLSNGQAVTLVARYEFGGIYDILAYRHDANGRQIGGPVQLVSDAEVYVNSITGAGYIGPSIAASPYGNYAVSWHEETNMGPDQIGYAVWTQVFRADGSAVAPPRITAPIIRSPVDDFGLDQESSHLAARGWGGYALAWMRDEQQFGSGTDVWFRLLAADGSTATQQIMVNSDRRAGEQVLHDVVDLGAGRTLITYFHQIPDAIDGSFDGGQLYGRVFGPAGQALTASFMISEGTPYSEMAEGNTLINVHGSIVSSFTSELNYDDSEDVLVVVRDLTLPVARGGAGNDSMLGTFVRDRIEAGAGHDTIFGNRGEDLLLGGLGNDLVQGGMGRDTLQGNDGNDRLLGNLGNDRLLGNGGVDTLTGGAGADVFVFTRASGPDVVTDFVNGLDRLQIADHGVAELRAVISSAREVGGDTILTIGPNATIRLQDVARSQIDLSDFIF